MDKAGEPLHRVAIRSQVNDGPVTTYKAGQSFSELPRDRPKARVGGPVERSKRR
jgi:hypothetical protein